MLKVLIQPEYLAFLNQKQVPTGILIQVLLFLRFALFKAVRSSFDDLNYSLMNLSRLFTVQLSMFFVVFSNSDMLSHSVVFVNNFFIFLFSFLKLMRCRFSTASIFYQTVFCLSRTFFIFYFKYFRSLRQLGNFIKLSFVCQQLFSKKIRTTHISNQSGERGI